MHRREPLGPHGQAGIFNISLTSYDMHDGDAAWGSARQAIQAGRAEIFQRTAEAVSSAHPAKLVGSPGQTHYTRQGMRSGG